MPSQAQHFCALTKITKMLLFFLLDVFSLALVGSFLFVCCNFIASCILKPKLLSKVMARQGYQGPPRPFFPSLIKELSPMERISHDILPHLLPHSAKAFDVHGSCYMNWWAPEPGLVIKEPSIARKVLLRKAGDFRKPPVITMISDDVFGHGVFDANEESWKYQRHLLSPLFLPSEIKTLLPKMDRNIRSSLERWEKHAESNTFFELDVFHEFKVLTSGTIAEVIFRSTYEQSRRIFDLMYELIMLQGRQIQYSWIPFSRYIPTNVNIKRWKLSRELNGLILKKIMEEMGSNTKSNADLLGVLLDELSNGRMEMKVAIDNCKTFLLNGHGTLTAHLSWTMLLLALHPEWQVEAREEIRLMINYGTLGDSVTLNKLKTVDMILKESLRLYPPMPFIPRSTLKDTMVADIAVPKGMAFTVSIIGAHHDNVLWGADVNEFKPERFCDGAATASKHPMGFMPFSFGGRACPGQSYAQVMAKLVLSRMLERFEWELSPTYRHNPFILGTLQPRDGVKLLLKKL